ncbi:hypothetical protein [Novosphingobium album (ex Liu et al. 2023)]|uniref:NlpC/P60 domain-containing protein n=1 Tax=Novosphingobium album (ex Liu et al. 2023) TaxID=3031130 RepID=A0ABT5WL94_9SPHN|nr:hypothetical protein [Novosphingobium album (ex Liu et al. 2023)]MDE8650815.1 hypothetical protein [Novosphingobium album (ex Liu et al. 2023)]
MSDPAHGEALARAARALVGTRFRLHGRDPHGGLDCIGVLHAALGALGREPPLPNGYPLRARTPGPVEALARRCGLRPADGPIAPGDVMLARPAPLQHHVLIAVGGARFVHAHAGLRRVVMGPIPPEWPIIGHWRLAWAPDAQDMR